MSTQQTSLTLRLIAHLADSLDLVAAKADLDYSANVVLENGTGANQANQIWSDTRSLADGANETLDLNGSLTNAVGDSVTFTKVKLLAIKNKGTTTLSVGGAASNGFISPFGASTDTVKVPGGGLLVLAAPDATGFAAAAGTADQLKIANAAGAACDYDIVIVGVN